MEQQEDRSIEEKISMKLFRLFSILFFSIFLLNLTSASIVSYAQWQDGTSVAQITFGDSIDFEVDYFSMNSLIAKIELYCLDIWLKNF